MQRANIPKVVLMLTVFNLLRTRTYWNHEQLCKSYSTFYLLFILIQEVLNIKVQCFTKVNINSRISTSQTNYVSWTKMQIPILIILTSCIRSVVKIKKSFRTSFSVPDKTCVLWANLVFHRAINVIPIEDRPKL